jgi:hypothetical protein
MVSTPASYSWDIKFEYRPGFGYPETFRSFAQSLKENARIIF